MVQLSISDAAAATGKSRSTLLRAIKSGRLSASRNDAGAFVLDPAEVARVFPLVVDGAAVMRHAATSGVGNVAEVQVLQERLVVAERRAAVAEAVADERAAALDDARQSLADLRRLLSSPEPAGSEESVRLWWQFWR